MLEHAFFSMDPDEPEGGASIEINIDMGDTGSEGDVGEDGGTPNP